MDEACAELSVDEAEDAGALTALGRGVMLYFELILGGPSPLACTHGSAHPILGPLVVAVAMLTILVLMVNMLIAMSTVCPGLAPLAVCCLVVHTHAR